MNVRSALVTLCGMLLAAAAVLWLLGDASYCTGSILDVAGGH